MKSAITALLVIVATALIVFAISIKKIDVDDSAKIRRTLRGAEKIFVYEGLPHQMFESDILEIEKKRKDTINIAGFPFYSPKVEATGEAATALKKVASNSENYAAFSGEKRCGGFHPDYAIAWSDGSNEYLILFCYGCGEALIVDGKATYRYDFKNFSDLKKLFAPFKLKRPCKPKR